MRKLLWGSRIILRISYPNCGDHHANLLHMIKFYTAAAAAKSLQSCPALCNPIDGSPPGSSVPGILQGRTLEWVAMSFSNAWKWKVKVKSFSRVWLLATPWTAAYQAPPPMGFSRQEYWSGSPFMQLYTKKRIMFIFAVLESKKICFIFHFLFKLIFYV